MDLRRTSLIVSLAVVGFSGCMDSGDDQCHDLTARFSEGVLLAPPDERTYDGSDMERIEGHIELETHDTDNTGTVSADLQLPQGRLGVTWTDFHSDVDWKDGGIASRVVEHGASGHGHRMEPEMRLCSGGWGTTTQVTLDGKGLLDPVTGKEELNVHYMLASDAMMDPETLGIYQKDGQTPYDPQDADNGYVTRGRDEGHFAIWGEGAYKEGYAVGKPETNTTTYRDAIPSPGTETIHVITIDAVMTTIQASVAVTTAGALDVELRGPGGEVLADGQATTGSPVTLTTDEPLERGDHLLVVSGTGVGTYDAQVVVTPPTPLLIHVVFLTVEQRS